MYSLITQLWHSVLLVWFFMVLELLSTYIDSICSAIAAGFPDDLSKYGVISGLWTSSFALAAFEGVGKTSMVVRYIGKMFSHHICPTIGASFFKCNINIGETKVAGLGHCWTREFRSMAPMYKRNANAALLVFDITQPAIINSIKSWVKELQRNVEEPFVLYVAGNKTNVESQRKVAREEAQLMQHR